MDEATKDGGVIGGRLLAEVFSGIELKRDGLPGHWSVEIDKVGYKSWC